MGGVKPKLQTLDFETFNKMEGSTLSKKERETMNELKELVDSGEYSFAVDPMKQTYKLVNKEGNVYTEQTGLKTKGDILQKTFGGDRKRTSNLVGRMISGNYTIEDKPSEIPASDSTPSSPTPSPTPSSPKPALTTPPKVDKQAAPTENPIEEGAQKPAITDEQADANLVAWRKQLSEDEQKTKEERNNKYLDAIYGGYPEIRPISTSETKSGERSDSLEVPITAGILGVTGIAGASTAVAGRRYAGRYLLNEANPKYGPWRTTLQGDKGVTSKMNNVAAKIAVTTDPIKKASLQTQYNALESQLAQNRPFTKESANKAAEVLSEQAKKIDNVLDTKIAAATSSKPALATLDLKTIADLEEQISDLRVKAKGTSPRMVADTPEIKALTDKLKTLKSAVKTTADRVDLINITGALQADKAVAKLAAKPITDAAQEVINARKLSPLTPKFINTVLKGNAKAGKPVIQFIRQIAK